MPRLALACEYDGTDFVGWQSQANGRSVQAVLTAAVSQVADESVVVHGSGRTDAGVHAAGQVAHFDTAAVRDSRQWLLGINSNLPDDVVLKWILPVSDDFDARRSALWREYSYTVFNHAVRPVRERRTAWWVRDDLHCGPMTAAATAWLGERDFSAFRAAHCQSVTPMRNMHSIGITRWEKGIRFDVRANAFVYHMVRNIVGALVEIGRGTKPVDWGRELIAGKDRRLGAPTAPAHGLSLVRIAYPDKFGLPGA